MAAIGSANVTFRAGIACDNDTAITEFLPWSGVAFKHNCDLFHKLNHARLISERWRTFHLTWRLNASTRRFSSCTITLALRSNYIRGTKVEFAKSSHWPFPSRIENRTGTFKVNPTGKNQFLEREGKIEREWKRKKTRTTAYCMP